MNESKGNLHNIPSADIPLTRLGEYDRICDNFEAAWANGRHPQLEVYLGTAPEPGRSELLRELLAVEFEQRLRRGEEPLAAHYLARFPLLADWLEQLQLRGLSVARPESQRPAVGSVDFPATTREAPPDLATQIGREAGVDFDTVQMPAPATETALALDTIGRYRLTERLGEGGMGTVYRATHTLIEREVAIKVLRADLARNAAAGERFLREAQACVKLVHPNIVTTYDVDQIGDLVFMTMELLDGCNLSQYVQAQGPVSPRPAVEIIKQSAEALAYAHSLGIIHRDIKPHNIMVLADGRVKLLDLGLARMLDDDLQETSSPETAAVAFRMERTLESLSQRFTAPGSLLGTLAYMAPEQAANARQADARSDIYSLGCTFYYLLTGQHAFAGGTPEHVLDRHAQGLYQRLGEWNAAIPPRLSEICEEMLAVDPRDRFDSAQQVADELDAWLHAEQSSGKKVDAAPTPAGGTRSLQNLESLKQSLLDLQLVSGEDWNQAVSAGLGASWRTTGERGLTTMLTDSLAPYIPAGSGATPLSVLHRLQRQATEGTNTSLTEFQVQMILSGRPELLRLPNHILLERIGQGWKGELFKARNLREGRIEAVRTFSPASLAGLEGSSDEVVERFLSHCRKLARLDHPSLAKIYETGRFQSRAHGELVYLATEFVTGQNLKWTADTLPDTQNRVAWAIACIRDICLGMEYAAMEGFQHLNLSPLSLKGDVGNWTKVLDIGISELVMPVSREAVNNDTTPALQTDMLGLGRTFLYLLVGDSVFAEPAASAQVPQSIPLETWPQAPAVQSLPRGLRVILTHLIAEPHYQSFAEIVADLDLYQKSQSRRKVQLWMAVAVAGITAFGALAWFL